METKAIAEQLQDLEKGARGSQAAGKTGSTEQSFGDVLKNLVGGAGSAQAIVDGLLPSDFGVSKIEVIEKEVEVNEVQETAAVSAAPVEEEKELQKDVNKDEEVEEEEQQLVEEEVDVATEEEVVLQEQEVQKVEEVQGEEQGVEVKTEEVAEEAPVWVNERAFGKEEKAVSMVGKESTNTPEYKNDRLKEMREPGSVEQKQFEQDVVKDEGLKEKVLAKTGRQEVNANMERREVGKDDTSSEQFKTQLMPDVSVATEGGVEQVVSRNARTNPQAVPVDQGTLLARDFQGKDGFSKTEGSIGAKSSAGIGDGGKNERLGGRRSERLVSRTYTSTQQEVVDKVKALIKESAVNRTNNTMVVKITPVELGALTVKVTHKEGQVYARITPDNMEVENMLRQRSGEITQALSSAGFKIDDVHISFGHEVTESESFQFGQFLGSKDGTFENQNGFYEGGSHHHSGRGDMASDGSLAPKSPQGSDEVGWVA